jgi:hypothetical protein
MEPEGSSPRSHKPSTGPYPEPGLHLYIFHIQTPWQIEVRLIVYVVHNKRKRRCRRTFKILFGIYLKRLREAINSPLE